MVNPSDEAIQEAFTASFLAEIPPQKVKDTLARGRAARGTCSKHEVVSIKSDFGAVLRLTCERGLARVAIAVDPLPPHAITGLIIRPASDF